MSKYIVYCGVCGAEICVDEIEYNNRCNDLGEDYGEVYAKCNVCNAEYETSKWGEWDSNNEAIEYLIECIKNNKN